MELAVAFVGFLGVSVGYVLRPIGENLGLLLRERHEESKRRAQFQYDTLSSLSDGLESFRATAGYAYAGHPLTVEHSRAMERVRVLTFRVADDDLRKRLGDFLVARGTNDWATTFDAAVERLGEVIRAM